jgi:hypothetical protein
MATPDAYMDVGGRAKQEPELSCSWKHEKIFINLRALRVLRG